MGAFDQFPQSYKYVPATFISLHLQDESDRKITYGNVT
jgi:hypothetical protein